MQVELAVEILEMAVTVDEAGQHRLACDVDDLGTGRHWHLALAPHRAEAAVLDHDGAVLDGGRPVPSIRVPPCTTNVFSGMC